MVWREERGDKCGAARKEGVGGARTRDYRVCRRRQCSGAVFLSACLFDVTVLH